MSGPKARIIPHYRWFICGLLFYATTVNYMDRMVLSILKPTIASQLHWTDTQYGLITSAFQFGYAIMMPFAGRFIDWLGLRAGYTIAVLVWSFASMSHSLAGNAIQFGVARTALGLGEAANFPASIKAVADWFPQRERALATGIFNSGTNVGAILAPLAVPLVTARFGWHAAFLFTGSLSLMWALVWIGFYREPEDNPHLSRAEYELIRSGEAPRSEARVPYLSMLSQRATWAFLLAKFMTDPVWWFYLFWLPGFLQTKYQLNLLSIGPPLITVYLAADAGSIGGGWLSSFLLKRGFPTGTARKTAMLVCALCVSAVIFIPWAAGNLWATVGLISIATAAHQGWSANVFTLASDCFPRGSVGSVVGLGGLAGAVGGMLAQPAIGHWLDISHESYDPIFFVAGSIYLVALAIIHVLLPRFEREEP